MAMKRKSAATGGYVCLPASRPANITLGQARSAVRRYLASQPTGDDDYFDFPVILGQGSLHDLSDADPRNPRLAGLKSVSYAGACSLRGAEPERRPIGFHRPKRAR